MVWIRIAFIVTAIVVASGIVAYLFTRDRKYLKLSGRVAKWALVVVAVFLSLMLLERMIR